MSWPPSSGPPPPAELMASLDLEGQVALVTGASRGIGAAIACRLAEDGACIAVNYHTNLDAANHVVETIAAAGGNAFAIAGDVSQEDSAESVVNAASERWGRIDILVNNAGITRDRLLLRMSCRIGTRCWTSTSAAPSSAPGRSCRSSSGATLDG